MTCLSKTVYKTYFVVMLLFVVSCTNDIKISYYKGIIRINSNNKIRITSLDITDKKGTTVYFKWMCNDTINKCPRILNLNELTDSHLSDISNTKYMNIKAREIDKPIYYTYDFYIIINDKNINDSIVERSTRY